MKIKMNCCRSEVTIGVIEVHCILYDISPNWIQQIRGPLSDID